MYRSYVVLAGLLPVSCLFRFCTWPRINWHRLFLFVVTYSSCFGLTAVVLCPWHVVIRYIAWALPVLVFARFPFPSMQWNRQWNRQRNRQWNSRALELLFWRSFCVKITEVPLFNFIFLSRKKIWQDWNAHIIKSYMHRRNGYSYLRRMSSFSKAQKWSSMNFLSFLPFPILDFSCVFVLLNSCWLFDVYFWSIVRLYLSATTQRHFCTFSFRCRVDSFFDADGYYFQSCFRIITISLMS